MDTPATESTASISVSDAASLFAAPPQEEQTAQAEPASVEAPQETPEATQAEANPETVEADPSAEPAKVTIEVDGKTVELTKAELADYYKNGLRQADYTRKTMETAEQRKAAEAEAQRARQERMQYAQGLQQAQAVLQAQLQEQSQIDAAKLLETDPVEYLKQQHLFQQRQAQLQRIHMEQQQLAARFQQEQAQQMQAFLQTQQQELLAKLPDWKDESKAKAEKEALKSYLMEAGFDEQAIAGISDHRAVVLARKAMLYDKVMAQANSAAKKVAQLPQKVERPGVADTNPLDGRTAAMKRLEKSNSLRDAATVLSLLN